MSNNDNIYNDYVNRVVIVTFNEIQNGRDRFSAKLVACSGDKLKFQNKRGMTYVYDADIIKSIVLTRDELAKDGMVI
jgi:hypothetical protein